MQTKPVRIDPELETAVRRSSNYWYKFMSSCPSLVEQRDSASSIERSICPLRIDKRREQGGGRNKLGLFGIKSKRIWNRKGRTESKVSSRSSVVGRWWISCWISDHTPSIDKVAHASPFGTRSCYPPNLYIAFACFIILWFIHSFADA